MTYETFFDEYSKKEIHYILWESDFMYDATIEIQAVYDSSDNECDYSDKEADDWTDEILATISKYYRFKG